MFNRRSPHPQSSRWRARESSRRTGESGNAAPESKAILRPPCFTGVQLALIADFADHGTASEETLAATTSLAEAITERQHRLRSNFFEHFELFTNDESRKLYKQTFNTR
jgi:hypothetical protein